MTLIDHIDQRVRKKLQGRVAAFYSSYGQQKRYALSGGNRVVACGSLG